MDPNHLNALNRLTSVATTAPAVGPVKLGNQLIQTDERTLLMGILNTTPDSFSDGGEFSAARTAIEHGRNMFTLGADIVDVGGESTRPGADPVTVEEELERVLEVVQALSGLGLVSIDTMKHEVALQAVRAGATIVNDVTGLRDPRMVEVVADTGATTVVMHMQGEPRTMQQAPVYDNVVDDLLAFFETRLREITDAGIDEQSILLDPGIGFGKTVAQNYELLRNLSRFRALGRPILLGPSRKSFIGAVLNAPPQRRIWGTAATVALAVANGAGVIRIHDVQEMNDVVRIADAARAI